MEEQQAVKFVAPISRPRCVSTGGGYLFFFIPKYSICFFRGRGGLFANLPYCTFEILLSVYNEQIFFH